MKDIPGFEGLYAITKNGKVWSYPKRTQKGGFMKSILSSPGYLQVALRKNNRYHQIRIHRLLAVTYISNPHDLPQINHKDGNKLNNCLENLEWCTKSENMRHSWNVLGNKTLGERTSGHKLTEIQVKEIRRLHENGVTEKVLAVQFGIDNSNISRIISRHHWSHI